MSGLVMKSEDEPLLDGKADVVIATSTTGGSLEMTVHALLESDKENEVEQGMVFIRRVFGLLVLQYITILFISAPFTIIEAFKNCIHPYHNILEVIAVAGIVASLSLAILKGTVYPFARIALASLTLFVALELGLSFSAASWGNCGLIAVAQATTSFAVILALLQFETRDLEWLSYTAAGGVCLFLSGLWMVILVEIGVKFFVAVAIGMGGWAFALINLYCCHTITKSVAPNEVILATLFILVPEALLFAGSKNRHPKDKDGKAPTDYGGVGTVV